MGGTIINIIMRSLFIVQFCFSQVPLTTHSLHCYFSIFSCSLHLFLLLYYIFFLQSYTVLFLLWPSLSLRFRVSRYTKFVVSHHWHQQHSAQKFKRKLNNFLSPDKKKIRCNLQSSPFSTRAGFENKDNTHLISAKQHRERLRWFYACTIKKKKKKLTQSIRFMSLNHLLSYWQRNLYESTFII